MEAAGNSISEKPNYSTLVECVVITTGNLKCSPSETSLTKPQSIPAAHSGDTSDTLPHPSAWRATHTSHKSHFSTPDCSSDSEVQSHPDQLGLLGA